MAQLGEVDAEWIVRLRKRDPATLEAAVHDHAAPLYRMARVLGFPNQEAEDLVQDVFEVFLTTLDRFEGRSQLRTWLIGILRHKAHERRRELMREEKTDPIDDVLEARFNASGRICRPPEDIERLLASREIGLAIEGCLAGLPPQQREVFVLREMEDLPTSEICKIMEVSTTHMGVLLHRARGRLRQCLLKRGWKSDT